MSFFGVNALSPGFCRDRSIEGVFELHAIGLAARKVAAVTGDARRALEASVFVDGLTLHGLFYHEMLLHGFQVCRRASEIAEERLGADAKARSSYTVVYMSVSCRNVPPTYGHH